ncbi:MAG: hypothetical protein J5713_04860 [Clostridia bacterium]|nr:hypothetical protein [Clostridia bacterium]
MRKRFFEIFAISVLVLALTVCACSFVACNKKLPYVDYSKDNNFEVKTQEYVFNPSDDEEYQFGAVVYIPQGVQAKYGFVFFVGSFIPSEYYAYLGNALAKQGYVVAIPNVMANSAYSYYDDNTKVATKKLFEMYGDVKFFVGGHSQGGGAALRFADEEEEHILGAVFLAPLALQHELLNPDYDPYDPNSDRYIRDENGHPIVIVDTLADSTLPTLLLEADHDHVLNDSQKAEARTRMSKSNTRFVLQNACHMGFSTMKMNLNGDGADIDEEDVIAQRQSTVSHVLDFFKSIVCAK